MSVQAVLSPVFVLIALTFGLLFWGGMTRYGAIKTRQVRVRDIALGQSAWPAQTLQIGRSFQNQLELPVLFYVLVGFALFTHKADLIFVILSWIFVVLRLAHAFVHVTSNVVPRRFGFFLAGVVVLTAMWVIFAVQLFTGA